MLGAEPRLAQLPPEMLAKFAELFRIAADIVDEQEGELSRQMLGLVRSVELDVIELLSDLDHERRKHSPAQPGPAA